MNDLRTILAIADPNGEGSDLALQRAVDIARASGARILWFGFAHTERLDASLVKPAVMETLRNALLDQKRARMQQALDGIDTLGVDIDLEVMWEKHLASRVSEQVVEQDVDLVIKTGRRSETWLYTPSDWQLLRECPAPVMIVASRSWRKRGRLLVAVDLGAESSAEQEFRELLMEDAAGLAATLGLELHCAYSIEVPTVAADLDLIDRDWYAERVRQKIQPTVEQLAERFDLPLERFHFRTGKPGRTLPSIADQLKADLVVLGTLGRKGIRGKLMGNTAEDVLTRLRTDILAIKP